jgi:hypothetical protein
MTMNNSENEQELVEGAILKYEDMVEEKPERVVTLEDYKPATKTVSEEEEEGDNQSDIKAILRILRPKFANKRINEYCRSAMDTRIPPDNLIDKHHLICLAIMEEQCNDVNFSPVEIITLAQDALLIGFEGRGIGDMLELAGVVKQNELDHLSRELGMAS